MIPAFVPQTAHKRTHLCHIANHSHILLVQVGISSRVQTQSLHLLPHDQPTAHARPRRLHSDLDDEQEAAHAHQDVRGGAELRQARAVLLAGRAVVAVVAEAARSLFVAVVAADAAAAAQLAVVLAAGDGARERVASRCCTCTWGTPRRRSR